MLAAANRVLRGEIEARVEELSAARDEEFALSPDGTFSWRGGAVARLAPGESAIEPQIDVFAAHCLDAPLRDTIRRRLVLFWGMEKRQRLGPLLRLRHAELEGAARGLVYQLCEALGALPATSVEAQCAGLSAEDRRALGQLGVRLGTETVFVSGMLKPGAAALAALLWAVKHKSARTKLPGGVAAPRDPAIGDEAYLAIGYRVLGKRVLRVDKVEIFAAAARRLARDGPFGATPELAALASASRNDVPGMLSSLPIARFKTGAASPSTNGRRISRAAQRLRRPMVPLQN